MVQKVKVLAIISNPVPKTKFTDIREILRVCGCKNLNWVESLVHKFLKTFPI